MKMKKIYKMEDKIMAKVYNITDKLSAENTAILEVFDEKLEFKTVNFAALLSQYEMLPSYYLLVPL